MLNVEIIDELMGNGKTTTVLRYVENEYLNNNKKWIYVTEYLAELETRTQENPDVAGVWKYPDNSNGTKLDSFIDLVNSGCGLIGITHNLFKALAIHPAARRHLYWLGYNLYIDETISMLEQCDVKSGDFMLWLNHGIIEIDKKNNGRVSVVEGKAGTQGLPSSFDRFAQECASDCIHASIREGKNGTPFVAVIENIPDTLLRCFDRLIITTYKFDGSVLNSYLKLNNIRTVKSDIKVPSRINKAKIRELLVIDDRYNDLFAKHSLSVSWYDELKSGKYKDVDKLLGNTIRNIGDRYGCKHDHSLLGYTHPSKMLPEVGVKGICIKSRYKPMVFHNDENGVVTKDKNKQLSCYIPCNARASNDYANKTVMIHAFNRYPTQAVKIYLEDIGFPVDSDVYALSEMLQWIWRSCIRKGEKVRVFVLSQRMNKLLKAWLNDSCCYATA